MFYENLRTLLNSFLTSHYPKVHVNVISC